MKKLFTILAALTATITISAQQRVNLTLNETAEADYYKEKRFALIIDNTADQQALSDSLNNLGFDVLYCINAPSATMRSAAETFIMMAPDYDALFAYIHTNTLQKDTALYLLPTDILPDNENLPRKSVNAQKFLNDLNATGKTTRIAVIEPANASLTGSNAANPVAGAASAVNQALIAPEGLALFSSLNNDCLGNLAENLYDKAKAEEKEALAAVAALDALEQATAAKKPETAEEYYNEGMKMADPKSTNYDIEEALTYLKIAASKNHVDAMYQLALLYEKRDQIQSMLWMGRASSAGHEKAKEYVKARKTKPVGHDIIK